MANPDYGGHKVTMLYAGDDDGPNRVAAGLAKQIGFEPIYLGPLKEARLLEPLAMAWIILARHRGLGLDFALDVVRRPGSLLAAHLIPSTRRRNMADTEWGKCKDCKWFQIEPDAQATNNTMGLCIEEDLQRFRLCVSGNSGCNHFMPGKPARAKGSSGRPTTAQPTR